MGINKPPWRRGRWDDTTDLDIHISIQANTRQDKSPDIDIRDKPRRTPYGAYGCYQEGSSAISDLAECGFKEGDYPVVDYVMVFQAAKSTMVRLVIPNIVLM